MDFFTTKDWLNREPPYAFRLDHILFVVIGISIGVGLAFLLRKKDKKTVKIALIVMWAFAVTLEVVYYGTEYILCIKYPNEHPFVLEGMLPFHSCSMFMYVFPVAMFVRNKYIKTAASNFLVVVNMIMGFITLFVGCPPKGSAALSFGGVQSITYHILIVVVPLVMLITNYYDIKKEDIKYGLACFGTLAITMWVFDAVAHCDYFYFYDGRTFGVLYVISEHVPHIVWTLIVVTCYILTALIIHYLIIGIKHLVEKKKNKPAEE